MSGDKRPQSTRARRSAKAEREQREAARRERQTKNLKMRLEGHDFETIAETLGYGSRQSANQDYRRALDAVTAENEQTVDTARRVELARLDTLQTLAWAHTGFPEPTVALKAIETVLKISAHRARMMGLDQPVKHELSFDAVEHRITELAAFLAEHEPEADPDGTDTP
jgi:hypothetical protein